MKTKNLTQEEINEYHEEMIEAIWQNGIKPLNERIENFQKQLRKLIDRDEELKEKLQLRLKKELKGGK